jgi:hypothetical protein
MAANYGHHGSKVRKVVVAPVLLPSQSADPLQTSSNSRGPPGRISRGGSSKGANLLAPDNRTNQDGFNPPGTARSSRQYEQLEVSAVEHSSSICCNMNPSDLKSESLRFNCYNNFEATIIEERRSHRQRSSGRTITSIVNNPKASMLSSFTKATSSGRGMVGALAWLEVCAVFDSVLCCILDNGH